MGVQFCDVTELILKDFLNSLTCIYLYMSRPATYFRDDPILTSSIHD